MRKDRKTVAASVCPIWYASHHSTTQRTASYAFAVIPTRREKRLVEKNVSINDLINAYIRTNT